MPSVEVQPVGTQPAPAEWDIPDSATAPLQVCFAHFDGTAAGGPFLPTLEIVSNVGATIASITQDTPVQPGDTADATWGPFLRAERQSFLTDQLDVFGSVTLQVSGANPNFPWTLTSLPSPSMHIDPGNTTHVIIDVAGLYSAIWTGTISITGGGGAKISAWSFLIQGAFARAVGETIPGGGPTTETDGLDVPIQPVAAGSIVFLKPSANVTLGTWFANGFLSIQRWA